MSTIHQEKNAGLRDPYRTLLILFWGGLMALAALAGQIGGKDDLRISGSSATFESQMGADGSRLPEGKPSPAVLLGY